MPDLQGGAPAPQAQKTQGIRVQTAASMHRFNEDISSILERQREDLQAERMRRTLAVRIAAALLVIVLLLGVVLSGTSIHTDAMSPTLSNGDTGLVWKLGSRYQAGDIVLFRTETCGAQILRVIAVPGDTVRIDSEEGAVIVNNRVLEESYTFAPTLAADISYPVTLDSEEYFLLGDNRENAMDSRFSEIGPVSGDDIVGKLIYLLRRI